MTLRPGLVAQAIAPLLIALVGAGSASGSDIVSTPFRVRPYLQNPAADAMTVRWFSDANAAGTLTCDGRTFTSSPVLSRDLDYQMTEPAGMQHASPPFLHSVRITGLKPATSYPYSVEQSGETAKAVLTTAPEPGEVGRGGGVRLFFYADAKARPDSRQSRAMWPASPSLPGGPRPRWVGDRYLVEETTAYRTNLALIASRAAESLRAGNPVLCSIVGDLVESGGEQRHWDEFWRHNAGEFGTLASRVPIVAVMGEHDIFGGPQSDDRLRDLGGYTTPVTLLASRKFLTYFEHPENGASDERHIGRYHRLDFGPVTLLSLDTTNGGSDSGADDTNHFLDRQAATHIPDYTPGSEQHDWLKRELEAARARGRVVFVQFHHAPFSGGMHGRNPGRGDGKDPHSGQPLRSLAGLFKEHGVTAVFCGHDEMYEHSFADGVHYYTVGIGGDALSPPDAGHVNDRQIFVAHDHAAERWRGDVLESGGKHYGHVEVEVSRRENGPGFTVSITPVYLFPVLNPEKPGEVLDWERRTYDDVLALEAVPLSPADAEPATEPVTATDASPSTKDP
jgi:hypothetical protein